MTRKQEQPVRTPGRTVGQKASREEVQKESAARILSEVCAICLDDLASFATLGRPSGCGHLFCERDVTAHCKSRPAAQEPICPCCRTEFELIELIDTASLRDVAEGRREEPETRMVPVPAGKISENAEEEDGGVDAREWYQSLRCEVCERQDQEDRMVLCDGCDRGYHIHCMDPPWSRVPRGDWYCPACQELREQYLAYERDLDRQYAERRAGRSGARGTSGGQRRGSAAGGGQRGRARLRRTSRRESDGSASDDSFVVPDSDLEDSDEGSVQFVSSSGDSSDESSGEGPLEEEVGGRGRRAGEERGQDGSGWVSRRQRRPAGAGTGARGRARDRHVERGPSGRAASRGRRRRESPAPIERVMAAMSDPRARRREALRAAAERDSRVVEPVRQALARARSGAAAFPVSASSPSGDAEGAAAAAATQGPGSRQATRDRLRQIAGRGASASGGERGGAGLRVVDVSDSESSKSDASLDRLPLRARLLLRQGGETGRAGATGTATAVRGAAAAGADGDDYDAMQRRLRRAALEARSAAAAAAPTPRTPVAPTAGGAGPGSARGTGPPSRGRGWMVFPGDLASAEPAVANGARRRSGGAATPAAAMAAARTPSAVAGSPPRPTPVPLSAWGGMRSPGYVAGSGLRAEASGRPHPVGDSARALFNSFGFGQGAPAGDGVGVQGKHDRSDAGPDERPGPSEGGRVANPFARPPVATPSWAPPGPRMVLNANSGVHGVNGRVPDVLRHERAGRTRREGAGEPRPGDRSIGLSGGDRGGSWAADQGGPSSGEGGSGARARRAEERQLKEALAPRCKAALKSMKLGLGKEGFRDACRAATHRLVAVAMGLGGAGAVGEEEVLRAVRAAVGDGAGHAAGRGGGLAGEARADGVAADEEYSA